MSTIIAETTDAAVELSLTVNDSGGGVTGLTVVASVYDPAAATNKWLNMTTGAWQASSNTKALTEVAATGSYITTADTSNAANRHLRAYYEITVGASGRAEDNIVLVETLDGANSTDQATILADVATIETSTTTNLDVLVSSRAAPGASMIAGSIATDAVNAAALSTDAVAEIVSGVSTDLDSHGAGSWATATGFATAGDAMTMTAQALIDLVDAVWDASGAAHLGVGSMGYLQDQAATGGAGVTPLQIEQAVWNAVQSSYTDAGSMGAAMAESGTVPAQLEASLDRYFQIVRKYGPIAAQQPIATKDTVHVGDVGIILDVPVILDGAYSDLADATSIVFDLVSPNGTEYAKNGLGLTTPTGSYTHWTSDSDVFDVVGRWRVQVTVTWPDVTTKQSNVFNIDVQPPMASL